MNILGRLFRRERAPQHDTSAYGPLYAALKAALVREGVTVGGTAGYPRIEIHSFTEGERQDKDGRLRQVTCTVECMSNRSVGDCVSMNEANLRLLTGSALTIEGWDVLGVVPGLLQDLTESSDPQKIIYRLLQEFVIWIEQGPVTEPAQSNDNQESTTN